MVDSKLFKGIEVLIGTFVLKVSKDKLTAIVIPKDEEQGSEINMEELRTELEGNGIIFGLLPQAQPRSNGTLCVAKGQPAENGVDSKVKMHVKPVVVRAPKKKDPDKDEVDYRELGTIVNVTKDKLLLEKISATAGKAGKNIFGDTISPKAGKDRGLKGGTGVYLSDDQMKVFAKMDGKFVMADGKPSVFAEHTIKGDVDLSVGNIAFGGSGLNINGEVMPGFHVKCRGDITIGKGVNSSSVMAGGNLIIRGGIVGEDTKLRAKGNIDIDFLENGPVVDAAGDFIVNDFVVQGKAKVGKKMTALNGKGTIIGGKYVIGGSMYVKELGSDAEIPTVISVGIVPALQAKKQKLDEDLALWSERLNDVIKNISTLEKMQKEQGGELPEDRAELLKKYKKAMPKAMEQVNTLSEEEKGMEEELEQMVNECVYVYGKLFPGVVVSIGGISRTISAEEEQVVIHFEKQSRQILARKMTREEREGVEQ